MFKRKLFKRALPIILSVAMVFQSMPATAMAAEDPAVVETNVEDSGTTDSGTTDSADETTAGEVQEPADEVQQPDADTTADGEEQTGTGTPADNEGQSGTETPVDSETQDPAVTPDLRPNQEGEQQETETTGEELQEAAAAIVSTRIKLENPELDSEVFKKQNDKSEPTYNVSYSEGDTFSSVGDTVLSAAEIWINDEDRTDALKADYLSYEWRTAGSESAMQGLPKEVGSYVLHLKTIPVDGVCGEASYDVYFNIVKAQLTFELQNEVNKEVQTGSKVSDFKAAVLENYILKSADDTEYDKKVLYELKAEDIVVYKADANGVFTVTEDTYFNSEETYKFTVKVTLSDSIASNYEVDSNNETDKKYYGIEFAGLTETKVNVTLKNPETEIIKKYDEQNALSADSIAQEYVAGFEVVTGEDDKALDEQESAKQLVGSPKWYAKEKKPVGVGFPEIDDETQFETGNDRYTLMTEDPKDAGEYYLVYVYPGENGKYKKGYSDPVKVTIEPVSLVLKPTNVVLTEGMDKDAVAKALAEAEYELYNGEASYIKSSDITGENATRPDFFGVSYSDDSKTQYYGPVFELETRQKKAAASIKEGATEEEKWGAWTAYTGAVLTKGTEERPVQYRVKFSGQKNVFFANGKPASTSVDVTDTTTNSAEKNYCVMADEETLKNNTLLVELGTATATEIKVDRIIAPFTAAGRGDGTIANPAWKIYDQDRLFTDRAAYKLADVTSDIKDTHEDITYTWQTGSMYLYEAYVHTDAEANEGADKKAAETRFVNSFSSGSTSNPIPVDAGIYRLHIEYKDSSIPLQNLSSSKDVYFLIKQQEYVIVPDTQYAAYGDEVDEFSKYGYGVYLLPDNSTEGFDPSSATRLEWDAQDIAYYMDEDFWYAMNKEKGPDGKDKEPENYVYSAGTFINDTENPYTYKAVAYVSDSDEGIYDQDGHRVISDNGTALNWANFTNQNKDSWNAEQEDYEYNLYLADIKFVEKEIGFSINMPQDKVYNGMPIAADLPENFITLIDKATGNPITDVQLNTGAEEVAGAVNVEWRWETDNASRYVSSDAARYGGTYTLYASFTGNENYKAIPRQQVRDKDGNPYTFTIKPLDVIVTPVLNEVTAGQTVDELVDEWWIDYKPANEANPIPESDLGLFENTSGERRNAFTGIWQDFDGYAILDNIDEDYNHYCYFNSVIYRDNVLVEEPWNSFIRYGRNYTVKFNDDNALFAQYAASYNIEYRPATSEKINRGEAAIEDAPFLAYPDDGGSGEDVGRADKSVVEGWVNLYWERDDQGVYKILPREGIPFAYKNYYVQLTDADGNDIPMDKNYVAVGILSPVEFSEELSDNTAYGKQQFLYRKSIKDAGGYVLEEDIRVDEDSNANRFYIKALFPVELDSEGKNIADPVKEFKITWEEGYTDTFSLDVTNAKLESNLREAVAPKSLAFNGVQAKMAVGGTQQLDVKITKAQLGDVIQINYRLYKDGDVNVTHDDYASIDPETGLLTALSTNNKKATPVAFEAYPVRLSADGKTFEEITGKGVKVAKGKVTITEVTAPAIKQVVMGDTTAQVRFTHVDDGYRREIYVVDASVDASRKKWKQADFEKEIAKMTNGQWEGIFAIKPEYAYKNSYNSALKLDIKNLSGLDAKGSYVVYVRNVSAARTLADGSKVALSAAGTVKAFDTTKVQVAELCPWFDMDNTKNTVEYYVDGTGRVYDDYIEDRAYTVSLFDKTAQLSVLGAFDGKPANPAVDTGEGYWFDLPLKAFEKANNVKLTDDYLEPKLSYYITDCKLSGNTWTPQRPVIVNKKQTNASAYATIAKNGKITLKGVGENGEAVVSIWVVADNNIMGECMLQITASPDSITAKKVKPLKVGDGIRLADYLEYKNGKNKIPNYWSSLIVISDEEIDKAYEAGYELHRVDDNDRSVVNGNSIYTYPSVDGALRKGEWIITAVSAKNSQKHTLNFTDWKIDADGLSSVDSSIELSSAAMDPVKGLKVAYVDDKFITLNFAYAGHPDAFDVEVTDARGSVVYKKLAWRQDALNNTVPNDPDRPWIQDEQRSIVGDCPFGQEEGYEWNNFKYFEKTKTYAYTIHTDKLMRLSAYTITVKPVYNGESAAKEAKAKTKTTNIPASYQNMSKENPNTYGGIWIDGLTGEYGRRPYLTSGNTYTLVAGLDNDTDNDLARTRGTDTLTWKSSNTKVASVKANPGSFTATLKAAQQGTTVITVTSKITKKVIARYLVAVKAVGKGAPGYGGDYENGGNNFYDEVIAKWDPLYEGKLEVLTLSNPVSVESDEIYLPNTKVYDRTWVQFTAPTFGEYKFECNNNSCKVYGGRNVDETGSLSGGRAYKLEAGQKIYFCVEGSFTLRVTDHTDFTRLTIANTKDMPLKVSAKYDSWISFTAPEDNYYTFNSNYAIKAYSLDNVNDVSYSSTELPLGLKKGQTVFIKAASGSKLWVSRRDMSKNAQLEVNDTGVTVKFTKDVMTQYVKFTASAGTGNYTFETPEDDVTVRYLSLTDTTEYYDGDAVVSSSARTTTLNVGEGDTTDTTPNIRKDTLFMENGETIVIELTLKDEKAVFTTEKPEIESVIKVTSSAAKELTVGAAAEPVTKETTATFAFKVPEESGTNKYVFNVTDGSIEEWYDSKHNSITYGRRELTVYDDQTTDLGDVHAGDTVYIKVTATEAEKDAFVSVTKADGTKALTVGTPIPLTLKNDFEDWYTFTVKKTGYYQFSTTVAENPAHTLYVQSREKVFSESSDEYGVYLTNEDSVLMKLDAGDVIAFKVWAGSAAADATTTATFSVEEITATLLAEGDTPVSINNEGSALCYVFTGKANESYTISWKAGENSGAASMRYGEELTSCNIQTQTLHVSGTDTYYITVTQDSATAVSGTLTVKKNAPATPLVSGTPAEFKLKGESVEYKFTIPEDSELGYAVIVENTTTLKEGETTRPAISVDGGVSSDSSVSDVYYYEASGWTKAYEGGTKNITISGGSADAEVTGNITVKPITAEVLDGNKDDVKVTKAAPVWYYYEVTSSDRYVLEGAANTDKKASVQWYQKTRTGKTGISSVNFPAYLEKGDVVYVKVSTTEVTEQSAAVKLPAVVSATPLTIGEDGITGTAEVKLDDKKTPVYYTFTAPEFASYTLEGYGNVMRYAPSAKGNNTVWYSGSTLEKGDTLLIKVTSDGTLKVTKGEITELKLDTPSKEITLKNGESAQFVFNTYVQGMYDFGTSDAKGLRVGGDYDDVIESENRLYFTYSTEESNERIIFSITNGGEAEAKFTVTAGKVDPVDLTLDKSESVTVQKGRISILRFKAPETGRYSVSCEGSDVTLNNNYGDDLYDACDPKDPDDYYTYTLAYNGTADSATATVTVTTLKTTDVSGEEFTASLEKDEVKWYAYKAPKTGEYSFTTEAAGVDVEVYRSLASEDPVDSSVIITEGSVVYVRVENTGEKQDAVIKATGTVLDELKTGTTEVTFDSAYTSKYMTFKAEKDGFYSFSLENGASYLYYYADLSKDAVDGEAGNRFFIMKDQVVFLTVGVYSDMTATVNVTEYESPETEALAVGTDSEASSVAQGGSKWFTFTAPSDGTYSFYSSENSADTYACLYAGGCGMSKEYNGITYYYDTYNDDGGNGTNFSITYEMKAGQKIYLETYGHNHRAAEYKVNVMRGRYVPQ